ncbi:hypothetical protein BKI52_43555 [marine bacterium AO1-C]|nr:hypothetical protein BKI52_43555 [marine bacterium AO1-C]
MWKSKFNTLNLTASNQLTRSQMSAIKGGASATADCGNGKSVTCTGRTCMAKDGNGCSCTKANYSSDVKNCGDKDDKKEAFISAL